MAQVFSHLLAYWNPPSPSLGTFPVDAGTKWVVRDIDAFCDYGGEWRAVNGLFVYAQNGGPIWTLWPHEARTQVHYPWRGRQVLEEGDELQIDTFDNAWVVRVSGYKLTLP